MNIVICAPHHWPIPTPAHTGHVVILDLAVALTAAGHDVQMIAPAGTAFPRVLEMPCANGTASPPGRECENAAIRAHMDALHAADVIHDWSDTKSFAEAFPKKSVSTLLGGNFDNPSHGRNVVVWTNEMRERALRGASDYEGTEFSQWHSVSRALKDAHIVGGGVDTSFWTPFDIPEAEAAPKEDWFLWLGRFHPARNYSGAVELAKQNPDLEIVVAGEHPDDATNDHQRDCALDAKALAEGVPNCRIHWLPKHNHREAVRDMYRRARAFLMMPSFREPFGLQQVEAMACGTPVVGRRIGSVPEVIEHGVTGWVVEPWYLGDACRKIGAISPAKCREEAVRRFDRSVMAKNYLEQYEACLKGGWG